MLDPTRPSRPRSGKPFTLDLSQYEGRLAFSRRHPNGADYGWTSFLGGHKDEPKLRYIEIGCQEGRSVVWTIGAKLMGEGSRIVCIDPFEFPGIEENFDHNIKVMGYSDKVVKLKGFSQVLLRGLELDTYDCIYIDGNHHSSTVMEDAILSWRLLKVGGIMIFDDYLWRQTEVLLRRRPANSCPKLAVDMFRRLMAGQSEDVRGTKKGQFALRKLTQLTRFNAWT